jgi:hypothetical protein
LAQSQKLNGWKTNIVDFSQSDRVSRVKKRISVLMIKATIARNNLLSSRG